MPLIADHPLRLLRIHAGVGQSELAQRIGAHRSTIAAIEEARTETPTPQTLQAIAGVLNVSPAELESRLTAWRAKRRAEGPRLSPIGRATLEMPASSLSSFPSFVAWRLRIAPNTAAFATLLGVNRQTVAAYEHGIRTRGMPETLAHALTSTLGISSDYLLALERLPPTEE